MPLNDSVEQAYPDEQTVTVDGVRICDEIAGVKERRPPIHVDHRGRVFEVFPGKDEFWIEDVVFAHVSSVRPKSLKGWGLHRQRDDRYTLICGEILVVLWDARTDSSTHAVLQKISLGPDSGRQLLIPAGVWHALVNPHVEEAYLLNCPTKPYNHMKPDKVRLSENFPHPPVELRSLLST